MLPRFRKVPRRFRESCGKVPQGSAGCGLRGSARFRESCEGSARFRGSCGKVPQGSAIVFFKDFLAWEGSYNLALLSGCFFNSRESQGTSSVCKIIYACCSSKWYANGRVQASPAQPRTGPGWSPGDGPCNFLIACIAFNCMDLIRNAVSGNFPDSAPSSQKTVLEEGTKELFKTTL